MKIAEALLVIAQKETEISEWYKYREEGTYRSFKKVDGIRKEDVLVPTYLVDECTNNILNLQNQIRQLRQLLAKANAEIIIDWTVNGERITLTQSIILIKQMRKEQTFCNELAKAKTYSKVNNLGNRSLFSGKVEDKFSFEEVFEVTYDTKKYRDMAEKLTREITKLEALIQQANWSVDIDWNE